MEHRAQMKRFDPFASGYGLPDSIQHLAEHPERGKWQTAIMLRKVQTRWPGWPLEYALATVDSAFEIYQADFIVMPPAGWEERDHGELPDHLSTERVITEGLLPSQAMLALNAIFGHMRVFHNGSMGSYGALSSFEQHAGAKATWKAAALFQLIGDHLSVPIGEHVKVEFRAYDPADGTLATRARSWAEGYVVAQRAQQLFLGAMYEAVNGSSSEPVVQ